MKNHIANTETVVPSGETAPSWGLATVKESERYRHRWGLPRSFRLLMDRFQTALRAKLSDYEKLGAQGCLIGDKKFSNFQYHQGATGLPSDAISLTPGTTPESDNPGLLFEGKWAAASEESFVSYDIEAQANGKPITGASLQMQFGEISGTGTATVLADLCPLDGTTES